MQPANYPMTIHQGATWDKTFTYKINDAPVNLTGFSARFVARAPGDDDDVISLTNGSGITLGGSAGTIRLLLSASQTAALDFITAVYNLEIESGSGVVDRLIEGLLTLSAETTT